VLVGRDYLKRFRRIAPPERMSGRSVQILDFYLRVRMHGGNYSLPIFSPHDDVITQTKHC
jgi:hypothetical protein